MVGVADCHRQRVGGVGRADRTTRQESPHHQLHLRLFRVAGANHRLFDQIGRVFGDRQPAFGRRQQHDAAGDAELQGRGRVAVDKGLLDRRLIRAKALEHLADLTEQRHQPHRQRLLGGGVSDAVGDMDQAIAVDVDDPPTGMPQPGIEPQHAHSR